MHRHLPVLLTAATAVVAVGLAGCSHTEPKVPASATSSVVPPASTPVVVTAPPTAPLPVPEALTDVLNRLADPNIPGANKVGLVEGATPESAATFDKFINALRDNGYLPMTFGADNIAWSDKNPSNVMASIRVSTAQPNHAFTFPMEFTPFQGGWQLSRRTAEMLLALGNSPASTTPPVLTPPPPAPPPARCAAPAGRQLGGMRRRRVAPPPA
ncbi:hypothetical protein MNAB215_4477 [Mycobacterium numidiamassiliense]|uniref:Low molecular weight antigen MTB12-like C-terminal domain-containing protein n=1 Tax=Mycobacterium numidiamassiliense TaxID=1841861 RepID=A0A2U3PES3_9MYCO|nr:hypothetical protein [Mycobacterium numidiamassiliense]SPM42257.1 hypothetical protein MNAB215_4477 [Mycobacterium numidiamassiliense]